ncbi:MAG: hypothetical protein V3R64_07810 [Sphingomonadales bacterium]
MSKAEKSRCRGNSGKVVSLFGDGKMNLKNQSYIATPLDRLIAIIQEATTKNEGRKLNCEKVWPIEEMALAVETCDNELGASVFEKVEQVGYWRGLLQGANNPEMVTLVKLIQENSFPKVANGGRL